MAAGSWDLHQDLWARFNAVMAAIRGNDPFEQTAAPFGSGWTSAERLEYWLGTDVSGDFSTARGCQARNLLRADSDDAPLAVLLRARALYEVFSLLDDLQQGRPGNLEARCGRVIRAAGGLPYVVLVLTKGLERTGHTDLADEIAGQAVSRLDSCASLERRTDVFYMSPRVYWPPLCWLAIHAGRRLERAESLLQRGAYPPSLAPEASSDGDLFTLSGDVSASAQRLGHRLPWPTRESIQARLAFGRGNSRHAVRLALPGILLDNRKVQIFSGGDDPFGPFGSGMPASYRDALHEPEPLSEAWLMLYERNASREKNRQ
jgi:hypothetical protein